MHEIHRKMQSFSTFDVFVRKKVQFLFEWEWRVQHSWCEGICKGQMGQRRGKMRARVIAKEQPTEMEMEKSV